MEGLAKHFSREQHKNAERGFIGLVLIRPREGKGEVALMSVRKDEIPCVEAVLVGRKWIRKVVQEWNAVNRHG
jgi:hypothetical protein